MEILHLTGGGGKSHRNVPLSHPYDRLETKVFGARLFGSNKSFRARMATVQSAVLLTSPPSPEHLVAMLILLHDGRCRRCETVRRHWSPRSKWFVVVAGETVDIDKRVLIKGEGELKEMCIDQVTSTTRRPTQGGLVLRSMAVALAAPLRIQAMPAQPRQLAPTVPRTPVRKPRIIRDESGTSFDSMLHPPIGIPDEPEC